MEETFVPFRGIRNDLKERLLCYKQDWTGGIRAGIRYVVTFYNKMLILGMTLSYAWRLLINEKILAVVFLLSA